MKIFELNKRQIYVNENSINVVVATDNLSSSEVAQIQNIILQVIMNMINSMMNFCNWKMRQELRFRTALPSM